MPCDFCVDRQVDPCPQCGGHGRMRAIAPDPLVVSIELRNFLNLLWANKTISTRDGHQAAPGRSSRGSIGQPERQERIYRVYCFQNEVTSVPTAADITYYRAIFDFGVQQRWIDKAVLQASGMAPNGEIRLTPDRRFTAFRYDEKRPDTNYFVAFELSDTPTRWRIYVNFKPERLSIFLNAVRSFLEDEPIALTCLKIAGTGIVQKRRDRMVIYVTSLAHAEMLGAHLAAHPSRYFDDANMPMTRRLGPGVSIGAESEDAKFSFGQLRAFGISLAFEDYFDQQMRPQAPPEGFTSFLRHVITQFRKLKIDVMRPYI